MVQWNHPMKTSFTTLACPDWTIDRVIDAAVANKYDAIDFRGYLDVVEVVDMSGSTT